ncbi:MAG: transglycosylase SLT domain-containing protein, partial [Clostridia bacterium]|nr:transglycosylase SLT domain-containing protein [Clostridia bacterium]
MNLFKTHKGFDSTLRYSVLLFCVLLIGYSFVVLWIPFAVFPRKYRREVEEAANEFAVDPSLLYAVMKTESNFRTNAVSQRGAVGLMQLLPETFS